MRGIPQGSILVPILFTKSRNDLPDPIESNCKIFGYDIKFAIKLQRDLDKLIDWGVIDGTYILEKKNCTYSYNTKYKTDSMMRKKT